MVKNEIYLMIEGFHKKGYRWIDLFFINSFNETQFTYFEVGTTQWL